MNRANQWNVILLHFFTIIPPELQTDIPIPSQYTQSPVKIIIIGVHDFRPIGQSANAAGLIAKINPSIIRAFA